MRIRAISCISPILIKIPEQPSGVLMQSRALKSSPSLNHRTEETHRKYAVYTPRLDERMVIIVDVTSSSCAESIEQVAYLLGVSLMELWEW